MDDLISRQAALDEADEWLEFLDGDKDAGTRMGIKAMRKSLRKLPSAQPEIIRCKDCKWFGNIGCAINIVDDSDRPTEMDFCSFAERRGEQDDGHN